jgi:hypothetical protein
MDVALKALTPLTEPPGCARDSAFKYAVQEFFGFRCNMCRKKQRTLFPGQKVPVPGLEMHHGSYPTLSHAYNLGSYNARALLVCSCKISGAELYSAENREGLSAKVGKWAASGTKDTWQDRTAAQAPPCAGSKGPLQRRGQAGSWGCLPAHSGAVA